MNGIRMFITFMVQYDFIHGILALDKGRLVFVTWYFLLKLEDLQFYDSFILHPFIFLSLGYLMCIFDEKLSDETLGKLHDFELAVSTY